jgi:nucleotide-binding universal stress UspA family protein
MEKQKGCHSHKETLDTHIGFLAAMGRKFASRIESGYALTVISGAGGDCRRRVAVFSGFRPAAGFHLPSGRPPKGGAMYRSILVPLDGSPQAEAILPEIEKLASGVAMPRVVLIRVVPAHHIPGQDAVEWQARMIRRAEDYIEKIKQRLESRGMTVDHHVPYGDPAAKILEICELYNYDLIAMSTHGRGGLGRWLMGSVADKVVRHSRYPVLLRRTQPEDLPALEPEDTDDDAA